MSSHPNPDEIAANDGAAHKFIQAVTAITKAEASLPEDPMPAEPEHPTAAEISPQAADQEAAVQKSAGSMIPMPSQRPQPQKTEKKEGNVVVAEKLAEQLGTSPELKSQMRIDERKMAVLEDGTLAALSHFSYRFVYDKVRYWGHITEWWLTGSQGRGGLARKHILQALANTSGIQSVDKARKPNVIARSLWDRNWKEKAEASGQVVEE